MGLAKQKGESVQANNPASSGNAVRRNPQRSKRNATLNSSNFGEVGGKIINSNAKTGLGASQAVPSYSPSLLE